MVSNVYNYYLSQYAHKDNAKYDTHKRSELRNTYNKMLKINRDAPLYKVDFSENAQKYAIDLKENARVLSNIANDLSDDNDSGAMTYKKSAQSSNSDIVDVEYIGSSTNPPVSSFEINVSQTAASQINIGNYLQPNSRLIKAGVYSFDLTISDITYEFEFKVGENETSKELQQKLSRLVNRSNIGLKADVLTDSLGNTAIQIESESTGISGISSSIFNISSIDKPTDNPVDILGLNRIAQHPANAIFSIDGNERSSNSNNFTINNAFEINIKKVTGNNPVTISLKDDVDDIVDSISQLINGYNNLVSVTDNNDNDKFDGNIKLKKEFSSIAHAYGELLKDNGIQIADNGLITVNKETIAGIADSGQLTDTLTKLGKFKNAIQQKAEQIAINPMNYVNNKVVAYKNPYRSLTDPYNSSMYSGMMFNGYI